MKKFHSCKIPGYTGPDLHNVYSYKDFYTWVHEGCRNPSNLIPLKCCEKVTKYKHVEGSKKPIRELIYYVPDSIAFDIETTSFYVDDEGNQYTNDEVDALVKGGNNNAEEYKKVACMWIWQLAINDVVFIGRTWYELVEFLKTLRHAYHLSHTKRIKIFVHNLSYEFQFMRKYLELIDVFAIDHRKPCYCCTEGIEFYCSYLLSGLSLKETAKMCKDQSLRKMVGDLDYSLLRHPESEFDETELMYCVNDVRVVTSFIDRKKEEDGGISKIKLTNTQYVRDDTRDRCLKTDNGRYNKAYQTYIQSLTMDSTIYDKMKSLFAGGFTHASRGNSIRWFKEEDQLASFDMCSFYPAAMLSAKYPCGRFRKIDIGEKDIVQLKEYMKEYACACTITFKGNVKCNYPYETFISKNKCEYLVGESLDNGRVREADELRITGTEYDLIIWLNTYTADEIIIDDLYLARKDYLPKPIIEAILHYYKGKTELKGLEKEVKQYLRLKGMLNSLYGMIVSEVCHALIMYKQDNWFEPEMDTQTLKNYKNKCLHDLNQNKKRFLYYPWGCWCTAICRNRIITCILRMGEDYIYCDTDSLKIKNYKKHLKVVDDYNAFITREVEKCLTRYNIPLELASPKTRKGINKPIGVLEFEGEYLEFKTLRAKAYMYKSLDTLDDGTKKERYHLTCAGLSKEKGMKYIEKVAKEKGVSPFEIFDYGLTIPKEESGRQTSTYVDNEVEGFLTDYKGKRGHYHELSYIHMENTTVTIRDGGKYIESLLKFRTDIIQ